MRRLALTLVLPLCCACSGATPAPDAGLLGTGSAGDAGPSDAGPPSTDCPELDGGPNPWVATAGQPQLPGDLGHLTLCVHTRSLSAADLTAATGEAIQTGANEFVIQYISQAPRGVLRHVTALLYLPDDQQPGHALVALSHATSGLGPSCGPTHDASFASDQLGLPLVAAGYAVVASDYPGMGIDDGSSTYLVGEGEALAVLDSAKAMAEFHDSRFDVDQLSGELFLAGHSQGGHSSLFAHQLFATDLAPQPLPALGDAGFHFLGSLSFAPALGDLRGLGLFLGNPGTQTANNPFVPLAFYANALYRGYGPDAGIGDGGPLLQPAAQQQLPPMIHDTCFPTLFESLPAAFPTLGDLFPLAFQTHAASCAFDGRPCPSFEPWGTWIQADIPGNFHSDVPALLLQGEQDTLVPPETTACIAVRLADAGTPTQTCGYPKADHLSIVPIAISDALRWMAARRQGQTLDVCDAGVQETCQ